MLSGEITLSKLSCLLNKGLLEKERICSHGEQILFFFRVDLFLTGIWCAEKKEEIIKVVSFINCGETTDRCIQPHF